jgi:hypothetical protein
LGASGRSSFDCRRFSPAPKDERGGRLLRAASTPRRSSQQGLGEKRDLVQLASLHAKAAKAEQSGLQWIPLDNHPNKHTTAMAAGPLLPHGKIIFDEEIEWTSGDDPEPDEATAEAAIPPASANGGATQPTPAPLRLTIPEAKAALALTFGIHPEAIKITVEG